jgi:hypothetical protein
MSLLAKKRYGMIATDKMTGFSGLVVGFAQYITGCDQYLVAPQVAPEKPGDLPESHWFDVNRLKFKKVPKPVKINTKRTRGAGKPAPRK